MAKRQTRTNHPKYDLTTDWQAAKRFLQLIHQDRETELRFIRGGSVKSYWGDFNDLSDLQAPGLKALQNLNNTGYNAYAVINTADPQVAHDKIIDKDKKAESIADADITGINALFVDIDRDEEREGEILDMLQNAALEPSLIVQSSHINKLHAYWIVADCSPEMFKRLQIQLIALFKGDPHCRNLSRIMRIPGFHHVKGAPVMTRIIDDPGHTYTVAEVIEAFGLDPDFEPYSENKERDPNFVPTPGITSRIMAAAKKRAEKVQATDVGRHNAALWFGMSFNENNLPQTEGEAFASEFAKLLPARGDEPIPEKEILDAINWAYETDAGGSPWPDPPPGAVIAGLPGTTTVQTEEVDDADTDDLDALGRDPDDGTGDLPDFLAPAARAPITIQNSGYARVTEKTTRQGEVFQTFDQLTNWTFTPTVTLRYPDRTLGLRGTLRINSNREYEIDLPAKAWAGRRELLNHIGGHNASMFSNSAADVSFIQQFILTTYQNLPIAEGTNTYGLHKLNGEWTLLFEDTQNPELFYSGTPVDPGSPGYRAPKPGTPEQVEEAKKSILDLPHLVTSHAGFAITGYAIASAFAPRITPLLGDRLPFLYTTGERESGKSSSIEFALTLTSGSAARLHKAPGMTPYQYDTAFSSNNNRLAALDEYRPGSIDDAQLRKHHDLATKYRGSGLASKDHAYPLNAPLIVSGEGFTEDAAALSRGVLYFIEKKHRGSSERYLRAQARPLWAFAHYLHEHAATESEAAHQARFTKARSLAKQATGTRGGPRMQFALTFIAYGLLFAQQHISSDYYTDEVILRVLEVGITQTLDGGSESKTNLETFLEQLGSAAIDSKEPGAIMTPGSISGELIIRISPAVELVKRRYGIDAAIGNPRLLRRYADTVAWVLEGDTHRCVYGDRIRGMRLVLSEVPNACDVSALEYLETKLRSDRR